MAPQEFDIDPFWGTKTPKPAPRASISVSPERKKSLLRYGSHRASVLADVAAVEATRKSILLAASAQELQAQLVAAQEEKLEPLDWTLGTEPDFEVKKITEEPRGGKYIPGRFEQKFRPAETTRKTVFKEDLERALGSGELSQLLAVFSTALDLDATLNNNTLMLATRHDMDAIRRKLRTALRRKINPALKKVDTKTLQQVIDLIQKDNLMTVLARFPEVQRARKLLNLEKCRTNSEKLLEKGGSDEETEKAIKALKTAIKHASKVESLEPHVEAARDTLAALKGETPALDNTTTTVPVDETKEAVEEEEEEGEEEEEDEEEGEEAAPPEEVEFDEAF